MENSKKNNKNNNNKFIAVTGAKEHNLKNINVKIPKDSLTVITGPSGSGKSSLALDVLYTEGKRRYIESLSSYARQFLGLPKKPDVEKIEGLCPAIAIDQKTVGSNPRSTVGTITEIYDYLRVLFARLGTAYCPNCNIEISGYSVDEISETLANKFVGQSIFIAAPIAIYKKGEFQDTLINLFKAGHYRFIIDNTKYKFRSIEEIKALNLKKSQKHNIDLLLDFCEVSKEEISRLQDSVSKAFSISNGLVKIILGEKEFLYSKERICLKCSFSFDQIEPRLFSFNSPLGACSKCHGLGFLYESQDYDYYYNKNKVICSLCNGKRLNKAALAVKIENPGFAKATPGKSNIYDVCELSIKDCLSFFRNLNLDKEQMEIANRLIQEIVTRLEFLCDVGLNYLTLNRTARTLSGGEGQRIRLATQIGSALSGVLYILDEPSIGLHPRDNTKLIKTLHRLRDLGNTVVVVEHDPETMENADYIIDMGPESGQFGGQVVSAGTLNEIKKDKKSLTGRYLSKELEIKVPEKVRKPKSFIKLSGAKFNNLKDISVDFPLGIFCGISGVSGSGKSTLVMQELVPLVKKAIDKKSKIKDLAEDFEYNSRVLSNFSSIENLIVIDQSPIGRTPRSTPATYLGLFDVIRNLFTNLPESNIRGYKPGQFSFNVKEGSCADCHGDGQKTIAMHFLADVIITCNSCNGSRFNKQTLEIKYKDKNIADILNMSAKEALEFFEHHNNLKKKLKLLCDVGLDYISLGQASTTLSGGEAQRIKLTNELSKRGKDTLYILDEPTTGLHSSDIEKLLKVLNSLVDKGNTLLVIEHNLDVLKSVDYLIDLGPEGGSEGGTVIAQGKIKDIIKNKLSYTAKFIKEYLD